MAKVAPLSQPMAVPDGALQTDEPNVATHWPLKAPKIRYWDGYTTTSSLKEDIQRQHPGHMHPGGGAWSEACRQIGAQWYLAEALTLLLGVGLFVGCIPERFSPGSFDVWGHSHQQFHVCMVLGAAFHHVALVHEYRCRQSHPRLLSRECPNTYCQFRRPWS
ncbi:uncharacterized protein PV07_06777 [Cladophialophora immunda]|uniref:Uncharacterized protein n=1 Tax=Cladophialophora immunda TaxID=569365 RepID=A0A0D2C963_9EURO|nr:uncharacterized protein PV07_06777 [Cladophialophora immunda]KIW26995.1 hypothetical protein PV07_06777 [Cladophialophora immunda]